MNEFLDNISWAKDIDIEAPYIKVTGGGGTGKSCALLARAYYLIKQGKTPSQIIILCSAESSVDALKKRAGDIDELRDVRIESVAQCEIDILSQDQTKACTQRNPRILSDFEYNILIEDMKVCGLKPKRLREMLKFFYKEISELGDEKEHFIQDSEESDVYQTLCENLRLRAGMLREELSSVAYKFMRDFHEDATPFMYDYVLVDDFQNLNRASQLFVEKLAKKSLLVAGCANEQVKTMEPYPYPQGFLSFELTHQSSKVIYLSKSFRSPKRISSMANSLISEGGLNEKEKVKESRKTESDVHFVEWTYPNDEFLGIARYIKHRLNDEIHPTSPRDIFVAVPNKIWAAALAKVLRANDIAADEVVDRYALRGDPRSLDKSLDLQAYTRLNLVADPTDVVAWRSWCGFGDYLTNSNHWFRLEKYAQDENIGIIEALKRASEQGDKELFTGAKILSERYTKACAFIEKASKKQGFSLVNECNPSQSDVPPKDFMSLLAPLAGYESAQELLVRANKRMQLSFGDENKVRIGLLHTSCGMEFDTVIIMGAIEGFYPARKTIGVELDDEHIVQVRLQERREWYSAIVKARYALVCSTIQKDESSAAEKLGMYAHRIRMENGKSLAILAPSPYLEEFGEEAPCIETSL